jgi:Flp pilus assembly protein TadG
MLLLLRRFQQDESGAFAIIFGVMAIVLIALAGSTVDFVTLQQHRTTAQTALDSAALALQPRVFEASTTRASIMATAESLMIERLESAGGAVIGDLTDAVLDPDTGTLQLTAYIEMPTIFVRLVGVETLGALVRTEATGNVTDVEVALALDVTGSMEGQKLTDLKTAVNEMVDILVKVEQTPAYSKLAIVPYSMGVNVGSSYAAAVRGPIQAAKVISDIAWADTGAVFSITGAEKSYPARITAPGHTFKGGERVLIWDAYGMRQLNGKLYTVSGVSGEKFELAGVNSKNYDSYSGNAKVVRCLAFNCELVVTSDAHGFADGDHVYIKDVVGTRELNGQAHRIASPTTDTFRLEGTYGPNFRWYESDGKAFCTTPGCEYYRFKNPYGDWLVHQVSTCVTERHANAFTDAAPTASYLGRNYPHSSNPCITNTIVPLTSNKPALKAAVNSLVAAGSTAGHIGVAWAWYLVAPNFGYLWPENSRPAQYRARNLLKAVVLMTDGEYNTVYCNGVISRSSTSGSGNSYYHNNCNAPNGDAYAQARANCAAMKLAGVRVYTIAFDLVDSNAARTLMAECATSVETTYVASGGLQLREAFADIARNIEQVRLSQ